MLLLMAEAGDSLAAVRRLALAALEAPDSEIVYATLARELLPCVDADQVHAIRLAQDGSLARGAMYQLADGPPDRYVLPLTGPSGVRHVAQTHEPLRVDDVSESELLSQDLVDRFGPASILFVPLIFEDEVHAVMVLVRQHPRPFSEDDAALSFTLCSQAATAIAVLEMRARLNARAEQGTALARAAGALNARLDLDSVLNTLCREADQALGGDVAGVYLGDAERGGSAVAAHGIAAESDWWGFTIKPGEGVGGQVLSSGEPAISNDYQHEVEVPSSDALRDVETAVSVPMRWDGELKGALSVAFYSMRRLTTQDINALQGIADLAAVACSNAEAYERARAAARTDSLTGLLNHGALQVRLREEIWRSRRSGRPLSCLLMDLDDFKPVNDHQGHLVGDRVLERVATAVATEFRAYDGLGRMGGDEFVVVLAGVGEAAALEAAERLRAVVADASAAVVEGGLTASVGVAPWSEPLNADELLDRADRALLLAKRRGKDGLVASSSEVERELATLEVTGEGSSDLMRDFWAMVTRCEDPGEVLRTLPHFLRRALDLEEVAVFERFDGRARRAALARRPGDPGQPAFGKLSVELADDVEQRLGAGSVTRRSLAGLVRALGLPEETAGPRATAGSYAAVPLRFGDSLRAVLVLRSRQGRFPLSALRMAEVVTGQAMTVLLSQSGGGSPAAVAALAAAIDARDDYTATHSAQVVELACEVARKVGLSHRQVEHVRDGALLHDVGKVGIPNEVLHKPGPLNDEEWVVMRRHPVIGERILRRTPELEEIAPLVRHEHERWDGTGYPDRLAGSAIPMGSRIILACDAYNAMITRRPYREPMSEHDAVAELRAGAGTQFDPDVVDVLLDVLAGWGVDAAQAMAGRGAE